MSVCPYITDVFIMLRVFKQEVLEFRIPGGMKKWIIFRELRQDFLEVYVMYETEIPGVNVMKGVLREGIKLCASF